MPQTRKRCKLLCGQSASQDASDLIPHMEAPVNVYRSQIIIKNGPALQSSKKPHKNSIMNYFSSPDWNYDIFKRTLRPNIINGIKAPVYCLPIIQNLYVEHFSEYKIRIVQKIVSDVSSENQQYEIIEREHRRAHRNAKEYKMQIQDEYYFPRMFALIRKYVKNCDICNTNKYDKNPTRPQL